MKNNSFINTYFITLLKTFILSIIPIFTFPYINRIILPEILGKVIWINTLTDYLIILAGFGISLYGPREIAYLKNKSQELKKIVNELFFLQIFTFSFFFIFYILILNIFYIEYIDKNLQLIFGFKFIFVCFSVEWYFQGVEKFNYIAKKQIVLNILIIPFYYIFIKESNDYIKYAILLISFLFINCVVNFFYFIKEIKINYKELNIFKHFKKMVVIFTTVALSYIYVSLDTLFIGILASSDEVAYYYVAIKVVRVITSVLLAGGVVISIKISILNEINKSRKILKRYFKFILLVFLPMTIGLFSFSKEIIFIIAGDQYLKSILIMRILSILVFLIGLNNFFGTQILYSMGKDKETFISILFATMLNLILNIFLIPKYGALGASIGTIIAESMACMFFIYFVRENYEFLIFQKSDLKIIFSSIIMMIIINIYENKIIINNNFFKLIFGTLIGVIFYILCLFLLKELTINILFRHFRKKLKRKFYKTQLL